MQYDRPYYNQFVKDMRSAGKTVEDYIGRFHYHGPAVRCKDWNVLQEVVKATKVDVIYDKMDKKGYIAYVGGPHKGLDDDTGNELDEDDGYEYEKEEEYE